MKILIGTTLALVAFAFNSILCRLALGGETIDAVGFTAIRLASGAITLLIISAALSKDQSELKSGNWLSAFFLFAYAIGFSFAYLQLTAATGVLILFGSVQITMICVALIKGERPKTLEWLGLILAFVGLIYLVFPKLAAPPIFYSGLMIFAGISWGFYTLRGKGSVNPLADTTRNFVRSLPMIAITSIPFISQLQLSNRGIILAILSGSVTSGIGYAIWYSVLKHHTATRAAILQLSVPMLVAIGGVIFLQENISPQLSLSSALILGGIGLAVAAKNRN